jgi:hypothetical protein
MRAVIDDQRFPVAVGLRQHAVQRLRQRLRGIARRDDERSAQGLHGAALYPRNR